MNVMTEPKISVVLRRSTSNNDVATERNEWTEVKHAARLWSASATHCHRRGRQGRHSNHSCQWFVEFLPNFTFPTFLSIIWVAQQ